MISLEDLARIAEIEFSDIVDSAEMMDAKLRIMLTHNCSRLNREDVLVCLKYARCLTTENVVPLCHCHRLDEMNA